MKLTSKIILSISLVSVIATGARVLEKARQTSTRLAGNSVMSDQLKSSDEAAVKAEVWQATRPDSPGYAIPGLALLASASGLYLIWRPSSNKDEA